MALYIKKSNLQILPNFSAKKIKLNERLSYVIDSNFSADNGFQPFAVFFYFCSPLAR
jgi:hypothetical protein